MWDVGSGGDGDRVESELEDCGSSDGPPAVIAVELNASYLTRFGWLFYTPAASSYHHTTIGLDGPQI